MSEKKWREFWAYKRPDIPTGCSNIMVELSAIGGKGSDFWFIEKAAYDEAIFERDAILKKYDIAMRSLSEKTIERFKSENLQTQAKKLAEEMKHIRDVPNKTTENRSLRGVAYFVIEAFEKWKKEGKVMFGPPTEIEMFFVGVIILNIWIAIVAKIVFEVSV